MLNIIQKLFLAAIIALAFCAMPSAAAQRHPLVSKWDRYELTFQSAREYADLLSEVILNVTFTSPSGESHLIQGFWDGGKTWKSRFAPNEIGRWSFSTSCSDESNTGLHKKSGQFECTAPSRKNRFTKHGPIRISRNGRYLMHEDGTPFFWMGDTAWNGLLLSSPPEWEHYIDVRRSQRFNAVQWVTTQWRASPGGNRLGQLAYTGREKIRINPHFFQELDKKVDALNEAGILNAPVLLWALPGNQMPKNSPGFELPEDQAIVLARYMVARWGGNDVAWILGGDGDYRGKRAEKWIRIGRAVFGASPNHIVMMHPGGMHWVLDEFHREPWIKVFGYQSGHGDDDPTLRWIVSGPPSTDWKKEPPLPFINLEPPYEFHISYQSKKRISPEQVRRAVYWSLLVSPTAGVSYGGHGVWGWDDGTKPPTDHPGTGTPLHWKKALEMPGAEQMAHVWSLFDRLDWHELRPAPQLLAKQPGQQSPARFITVSQTEGGNQVVAYTPEEPVIPFRLEGLPSPFNAYWHDPRTGRRMDASGQKEGGIVSFKTPGAGDWALVVERKR